MSPGTSGSAAPSPSPSRVRVLVVTVVHDPEDARIRHRQLVSLLDAGLEVTYAAPFSAYGRTAPPGVRGVDLPRARGRRRLGAVRAARRLIRAEAARTDVVLVHDPELTLALVGLRGPARVWDVHEDTAAALGMRGWLPAPLQRPVTWGVRVLERWADRRLHLLLAEDAYAERFSRSHPVVPNTVFVPSEEPPPPGSERVVYLGRLTVPRGALDLVALAQLAQGRFRVELIGPADPDCADAVAQAHADGWLHHHGFLPNSQALPIIAGSMAGLSLLHDEPNYAHSRPTKAMEYMAFGVPVITTPNPVSVDLVDRYSCGIVVPFEDPAAACEAILALQADGARREALGARGRRGAVADFDWRRHGAEFAAVIESWAAQRNT